jgi:NAD(P)-dependent dehydrogenase (short-subunit alcohol dehydrogenase family)
MVLDVGNRIRLNVIEPAAIATEMLKACFEEQQVKYKLLEGFHPVGRVGTTREVENLALFLASKEANLCKVLALVQVVVFKVV